METPKPPSLAEVIAAGYSEEAANRIVAEEQQKFDAGLPPYGPEAPETPAETAAAPEIVAETPAPTPETADILTEQPTIEDVSAPHECEKFVGIMYVPKGAEFPQGGTPGRKRDQLIPPSFMKPTLGGPTNPSYDADKLDSTGENEKSGEVLGPRGVDKPGDVMSDDERAAIAKKREDRLAKGMSPTHSTDSTGNPKGHFATIPQGNDKHGARIPDEIDYSTVIEPHLPTLGPRGPGAPKDTFHKK